MAKDVDRRRLGGAPRRARRQGSADPGAALRSLKEDLAVVLPIVVRVAIRENASKVIVPGRRPIIIVLGDKRKSRPSDNPKPPKAAPTRRTREVARPRPRQDVRCSRSVGAKVAPMPRNCR